VGLRAPHIEFPKRFDPHFPKPLSYIATFAGGIRKILPCLSARNALIILRFPLRRSRIDLRNPTE
jgi:hypothetical protein